MTAAPPSVAVGRTRVPRLLIAACIAAPGTMAAWAFWPLYPAAFEPSAPPASAPAAAPDTLATLNVAAFSAPIWVAEPPPPPPPAAPAPPPPLRLQLIAITREGDALRAVLYDPDLDRLHIVGDGERLGERTVDRVLAASVALRDSHGVRTLALREDAGGSK